MRGSMTKLSRVSRCFRKAYYAYVENLSKAVPHIAPATGILGHECLANLYSGKPWTDPIQKLQVDLSKVFEEERQAYAELPGEMFRLMRGYVLAYQHADKAWKVQAVEKEFVVKTPAGHELEGRIDLIVEDNLGRWVVDHKFVSQVPQDSIRLIDSQTALYYFADVQAGNCPVGVVFNYIRTKAPTVPKILKNGTISKAKIDTDVATYVKAIKDAGLKVEDYADVISTLSNRAFYARYPVPRPDSLVAQTLSDFDTWMTVMESLPPKREAWPRSLCRNCTWDCEFWVLCQAELIGMDVTPLIDQYFVKGEHTDGDEE